MSCNGFSFVLFSNLLSRPAHGQHRPDGIKTEHYKTGFHPLRGQTSDGVDPMPRVLTRLSPQVSPCSSAVSLPPYFVCQTNASALDANNANFSDTLSDSVNDQEEFVSSVWKHSDFTSSLIYLV